VAPSVAPAAGASLANPKVGHFPTGPASAQRYQGLGRSVVQESAGQERCSCCLPRLSARDATGRAVARDYNAPPGAQIRELWKEIDRLDYRIK